MSKEEITKEQYDYTNLSSEGYYIVILKNVCNRYTEFVSDDNSDCVCTMCGRKIESENK